MKNGEKLKTADLSQQSQRRKSQVALVLGKVCVRGKTGAVTNV